MYGSEQKWTNSSLTKFEIVALGCHFKMQDVIKSFFKDECGIEAFQVVEYFFLNPVIRDSEIPGDTFFPFIRRLLDNNSFHFKENGTIPLNRGFREEIEFQNSGSGLKPRRFCLPFENTIIGKRVHQLWLDNNNFKDIDPISWVKEYSGANWGEHSNRSGKLEEIENTLIVRYWQNFTKDYVTKVGCYPIASQNILYGYFIILWPEPADKNTCDCGKVVDLSKVFQTLHKYSYDSYLPTLILLHNYFWEEQIFNCIKNKLKGSELIDVINTFPVIRIDSKYDNDIERGIGNLWKKRINLLKSDQIEKETILKDSLLFREYNIASPGMIEQIRKIIQRAPHLIKPSKGKKLPSALIYGEAGSGKDTMAKLIQLFTEASWVSNEEDGKSHENHFGYFGSKQQIINISALKPNALFGPLFLGVNIKDQHLVISSLLTMGINSNKHNDIISSEKQIETCNSSVFILDELNSLDLDLQGVLLRIIENGEVTPLFDVNPIYIQHLIIGIVNEDPETLTREYETKNLARIKEFTGEFLGNIISDLLTKGRRLRPDLYYRLRRGLFIKIPSLRNRREDIPILFYFECENSVFQELRIVNSFSSSNLKENFFVHIELKAFETLMSPILDWPGNIRQLQSVATDVAVTSVKNYLTECQRQGFMKRGIISVTDFIVRNILTNYFPNTFEKSNTSKTEES